MKTVLLVNPHAGKQNILKEIAGVREILETGGGSAAVIETENPQQAARVIEKAVREKADALICCGGDGTLSETVEQVLKTGADVALGYIPAGTTNDFATSLGIPKDPLKGARYFLEKEPRPLDVGRFENRRFVYVASFGAFTKSSYNTTQSLKNSLGHLAYVIEGIKELPDLKSYQVRVETQEGGVYEGEYLFGAVSNSTSFGGIIKLDPEKVDPADGKFELTLVKMPKNLLELNKILFSLMSGKYDGELITFVHTQRAVFTCAEPMPWSLDGEYAAGGERVETEVLPQAVRMHY